MPYKFKFFKGCLPQILLGPFLITLPQIKHHSQLWFSVIHNVDILAHEKAKGF